MILSYRFIKYETIQYTIRLFYVHYFNAVGKQRGLCVRQPQRQKIPFQGRLQWPAGLYPQNREDNPKGGQKVGTEKMRV